MKGVLLCLDRKQKRSWCWPLRKTMKSSIVSSKRYISLKGLSSDVALLSYTRNYHAKAVVGALSASNHCLFFTGQRVTEIPAISRLVINVPDFINVIVTPSISKS